MTIYLRWLPEGQNASKEDFQLPRDAEDVNEAPIAFQSHEQLVDYLRDREWPQGQRPWVQEPDGTILTADDLSNALGSGPIDVRRAI